MRFNGPPLKWNRLNSYSAAVSGTIMVEIQCHHCEEDVELEDRVFGLFDALRSLSSHCDSDECYSTNQETAIICGQAVKKKGLEGVLLFKLAANMFHSTTLLFHHPLISKYSPYHLSTVGLQTIRTRHQ